MENSAFSDTDLLNYEIPFVDQYNSEEEQTPQEIPDMVSGPHALDMDYYNPVISYDPLYQTKEDHAHPEYSEEEGMEIDAQDQAVQESSEEEGEEEEEDMDTVAGPASSAEFHGGIPYQRIRDSLQTSSRVKSQVRLDVNTQREIFEAHNCGEPYESISKRLKVTMAQARYYFRKIEISSGKSKQDIESETIEKVQSHYRNGMKIKDIASLLGISQTMVKKFTSPIHNRHSKLPTTTKKLNQISDTEVIKSMVEAVCNKESYKSIASRTGFSISQVAFHIHKYRYRHGLQADSAPRETQEGQESIEEEDMDKILKNNWPRKKLDDETIQDIRDHHTNGLSKKNIGMLLNVSQGTIFRYTKDLKSAKNSHKIHDQNIDFIRQMVNEYHSGDNFKTIANRHDWSESSVRHHINKYMSENSSVDCTASSLTETTSHRQPP